MNYHFSKNYNLLWKLAQTQRVICVIGNKKASFTEMREFITGKNGIILVEYLGSDEKKDFIRMCESEDVQFLIPGEVDELVGALKEIADCEIKSKSGFAGIQTTKLSEILKSGKIQELLKKYEVK